MENEKCRVCGESMTNFISQDNKIIYMCPCCGNLYLPIETRNKRVRDYTYFDTGNFEPKGNFPTVKQRCYLEFLMKSLGIEKKINIFSLTKYKAQQLISALKEKYEKEYACTVFGQRVEIEKSDNRDHLWIYGFAEARIDDRQWLEDYKNKLHPNDDWTNLNLETYCRWLYKVNDSERSTLINDACKAGVVGFLD